MDGVKKIALSSAIKDLHPEDSNDYERGSIYKCFWEGDAKTKGGFYEATILRMAGKCSFFILKLSVVRMISYIGKTYLHFG